LHEETFYSTTEGKAEDGKSYRTTRKHLWQLTATDVPHIEGTNVRNAVAAKLKELGCEDPRKTFANYNKGKFVGAINLPTLRGTTMRRVRVRRYEQAFSIGSGKNKRWVMNEENHHIAVFVDAKGRVDRVVVSQLEAQRRKVAGEPMVQIPAGTTPLKGLATLAVGETILLDGKKMTVRSVNKDPRVSLVATEDGRTLAEVKASKEEVRLSVEQLRKKGARKIVVTPLGEIRYAND
jgi:hypothetical protein